MDQSIIERAASNAAVIARASVIEWVIELAYEKDGELHTAVHVLRSPLAARPDGDDLLPADADPLRVVTFPAVQLQDMPLAQRSRHERHYRAWLKAQGHTDDEADVLSSEWRRGAA